MISEKLLYASFWKEMSKVYTSIPARVVAVRQNLEECIVDVQPVINTLRKDGRDEEWGTILNVPVLFPCSSTSAFTFPINNGDPVLLHFSMRNIENFINGDGSPAAPNNFSKFDQNDAVAIPCLMPKVKSINNPSNRTLAHDTKDAVLVHNIGTPNEVEIRFKPDGTLKIYSPTKIYAEAPLIEAVTDDLIVTVSSSATVSSPTTDWDGNINITGNVAVTGGVSATTSVSAPTVTAASSLTVGGKEMNGHTHNVTGIQTGGSTVTSLGNN